MDDVIAVTGMVTGAITVGEYDKRITILTKERGKIQAFARGAKKPNSQFSAIANPFVFGTFYLHSGRSAYNLQKATISNYFEAMREDLDAIYYGSYFLELANYYGQENVGAAEQLNLIYLSLYALMGDNFSNRLVRAIYELKTLVINGEYPSVFSCISCGDKDNLKYFSSSKGGAICEKCGPVAGSILLADSSLYTMQYIISSPIKELFSFSVSDNVLHNIEMILRDYFKFYVDRDFKSLAFLE